MSDEDVECPKRLLEESCKPACTKYALAYEACAKRVENNPEGHCVGQSFDYLHCLDKCVYTKLDKYVK